MYKFMLFYKPLVMLILSVIQNPQMFERMLKIQLQPCNQPGSLLKKISPSDAQLIYSHSSLTVATLRNIHRKPHSHEATLMPQPL